jgi:aminoglycoside phosphotransferase (APT) family kinase protein
MAALHALDPQLVRDQLASPGDLPPGDGLPVTLGGMLDYLRDSAVRCQRDDLASAARWLIDHPLPSEPEVICHGDLHPFNALVADGQVTVLDWSACLLAPRAYDVAFTSRCSPSRRSTCPARSARSCAAPAGSPPGGSSAATRRTPPS